MTRPGPGPTTEPPPGPDSALDLVTRTIGGFAFGGDYNPEQWPREVWPQDIALMQQAGINLVTVGVFSWALLEPTPGNYDFGWLDEVLELLHAGGIAVDLATGTASPPPWFTTDHPQARLVDRNGTVRMHGGRQAFCPSAPAYRHAASKLARKLAGRYSDHPAVVMWHVNNEYGCHNHQCFCPTSAAGFRDWLQRRYGTLAELNCCWGTSFWSQRYARWSEVFPPGAVSYDSFANPTQQLDWSRFCSAELLECFRTEASAVRSVGRQPVTTNFMSFFRHVDYFSWAPEMDIVSNDDYLIAANATPDQMTAMSADLMRSLAGGRPWLLMEHSTSAVNWQPRNPAKEPGRMLRNSLQHIARGADGALFFQWRASLFGAEKFHSALLPHAGTDSARWREVVALGATLRAIAETTASTPAPAEVGIMFDWNSWWAAELDAHPSVDFSVMESVQNWHRELWRRNVPVDFVGPATPLDGYRLQLLPGLYLIDATTKNHISRFVETGGTVLVGYFSGIADENDHIWPGGHPGALRDILGVTVEEFNPLLADQTVELSSFGPGRLWSETARADTAQVLSRYRSGGSAGSVAVSRNDFGRGRAFYVGSELTRAGLSELIATVLETVGISADPMDGVEILTRERGSRRWTFVINHTAEQIQLPIAGHDLLGADRDGECVLVPAGGVAVIRLG